MSGVRGSDLVRWELELDELLLEELRLLQILREVMRNIDDLRRRISFLRSLQRRNHRRNYRFTGFTWHEEQIIIADTAFVCEGSNLQREKKIKSRKKKTCRR